MENITIRSTLRATAMTHNETCVLFKLPNELLSYIVEALPPPVFNGPQFNESSFPAFSLSHTCRWWRSFVMAHPRCWRYIPCTNSHWLEEGLRRSRRALLRLYVSLDYQLKVSGPLEPNLPALSEHASRVEAVIVGDRDGGIPPSQLDTYFTGDLMKLLRTDEFPVLKELVLAQWRGRYGSYTLPQIFTADPPPSLQYIFISNVTLGSHQMFLKAPLTHFEIVRGGLGRSMDEVVAFFKAVPQLETFIARDFSYLCRDAADRLRTETPTYVPRSIPLTRLRELTCDGAFDDGVAIFDVLALSPHCSVRISSRFTQPRAYKQHADGCWSKALKVSFKHLAAVPATAMALSTAYTEIGYRHLTDDGVSLTEATFKVVYVLGPVGTEVTSFELIFCIDDMHMRRSLRTTTFCRLAPHLFSAAHTARIELSDMDYSNSSKDLRHALANMPAIRTLTLAGEASKVLTEEGRPLPIS